MNLTQQLLRLGDAYSEASGLALSTIATRIWNDGKRFDRIRAGGGLSVHNLETGILWFFDNWPAGDPWPAGVIGPGAICRCQCAADA